MKGIFLFCLILIGFHSNFSWAEKEGTVKLYQIGKEGRYCVSTSGDESGCISGIDDNNELKNYLDMIKDQNIEFYNLSDVVHDMRFTGANAEDMPLQRPGAEAASKVLNVADPEKRAIECSFHGAQVGVGYRVLTVEEKAAGHPGAPEMAGGRTGSGVNPNSDSSTDSNSEGASFSRSFSQVQALTPTRLTDVSSFVVANGNPSEAEWLFKIRPELKDRFPEKVEALGLNKSPTQTNVKGNPATWQASVTNQLSPALFPITNNSLGGNPEDENPGGSSVPRFSAAGLISGAPQKNSSQRGLFESGLFYKGKPLPKDRYFVSNNTLYLISKSGLHLDGSRSSQPIHQTQRSLAGSELVLPVGQALGVERLSPPSKFKNPQSFVETHPSSSSRKTSRSWMLFTSLGLGLLALSTFGQTKKQSNV